VDHVAEYQPPKENEEMDEETLRLYIEGCAPKPQIPKNAEEAPLSVSSPDKKLKKVKKDKKDKKDKKKKKEKKKSKKSNKRSCSPNSA